MAGIDTLILLLYTIIVHSLNINGGLSSAALVPHREHFESITGVSAYVL